MRLANGRKDPDNHFRGCVEPVGSRIRPCPRYRGGIRRARTCAWSLGIGRTPPDTFTKRRLRHRPMMEEHSVVLLVPEFHREYVCLSRSGSPWPGLVVPPPRWRVPVSRVHTSFTKPADAAFQLDSDPFSRRCTSVTSNMCKASSGTLSRSGVKIRCVLASQGIIRGRIEARYGSNLCG